jgi:carbamoyl-phosphate synthase large subunit
MSKRILVTGAGTGASNNLIRSLKAEDSGFFVVGCNFDRFVLKHAAADRLYLIPATSDARFSEALFRLATTEQIDLVIPTTDTDVTVLSDLSKTLGRRVFLPDPAVIRLCQDKYNLTEALRARNIPAPETYAVTDVNTLGYLFQRLGNDRPIWCRARTGSRSLGAAPMTRPEQAQAWILYWEEMRGVPATSFTLSEYLPGRDFLCQSLWKDGSLVLANTFERLSYFGGENSPSGVSSLSSLAKTVADSRLVDVCRRAIQAIAPAASGAFSIDLKENRRGVPCITEINAGRFFIGMTAFSHVGKHNMPAIFVRLACGEPVDLREEYDAVEGYYLVRDLDNPPGVFQEDELFNEVRVL